MINVLFVCLGNICRSPLAEAIFNHQVKLRNLENVLASDSAGTANYHVGHDPDPRSAESAKNHNIEMNHKGRQFHSLDGKRFEYILAMDKSNYRNIIHELGYQHEGLYLMRHFDMDDKDADVPDPYYGGDEGFENVYQMLYRSISSFLDFLSKQHSLSKP